jgi:hypothetical protein
MSTAYSQGLTCQAYLVAALDAQFARTEGPTPATPDAVRLSVPKVPRLESSGAHGSAQIVSLLRGNKTAPDGRIRRVERSFAAAPSSKPFLDMGRKERLPENGEAQGHQASSADVS